MPLTYRNTINQNGRKVALFTDSILKTLRVGEFNSYINAGDVHLKSFRGCITTQLENRTVLALQKL